MPLRHLSNPAALLSMLLAAGAASAAPVPEQIDYLLSLSLEQLGQIEVTTASRRAEQVADTPASVFVIHRDELHALGIRSLPEALRLAPNLHVAQVDGSRHAISARGLKTTLSNKLLVMIDSRPIYTPLFAGVLWDMQDLLIEDIDRIEVVSGPGAAAWGANAVNGVINIITRPASETVGGLGNAWVAQDGRGIAVRQGFDTGAGGAWRMYARSTRHDRSQAADSQTLPDGWTQRQTGFRGGWNFGDSHLRLQANAFRGEGSARPTGVVEARGYNVLGEWSMADADGGQWSVQAYFDVVDRTDPVVLRDRIAISALELNHDSVHGAHRLSWGVGYRHGRDRSSAGLLARLIPDERALEWAHAYLQDRISVSERLTFDLGLRLDSNVYTGVELLPTARFSWHDRRDGLLWAALSRAVRSPARFDRDFHFPATEPFLIRGGPGFESEVSDVLELGYRVQPIEQLAFSLTAFHHWHDDLRGGTPAPQGGVFVANRVEGEVWGIEGWMTLRAPGDWEFAAGWLELRTDLRVKPGAPDSAAVRDQGNDPKHQFLLRATRRLGERQQLSAFARYVSALPDPHVPAYAVLDLRWSVQPVDTVTFGIGVRNLFDRQHVEFAPSGGLPPSEFGRAAQIDLRLDW